MVNKELLSPCGLYCGICGVMIAHRDNDTELKQKLGAMFGFAPDEVVCKGCMSDVLCKFCETCDIRSCAVEKNREGCHECDDFPCDLINNFPYPPGKEVILKAVPEWRELGTEKWVQAEEERHKCPECGKGFYRFAQECAGCGKAAP